MAKSDEMNLKPLILAIALLGVAGADPAEAGRPLTQKEISDLETHSGAKAIMQAYFSNFDMRLLYCSPFVEKTFGEKHYLIARAAIYSIPEAISQNLGVVVDEADGVLQGVIDDKFRAFVKTGDRRYLKSLNLDPNS